MVDDWRFRASPHVDVGGLRSYAGVPLRLETDFGDNVALGSLCVASNKNADPLTRHQQLTLARFSDWIVADIVQSARARRQRERRRMTDLIARAQREADELSSDKPIIKMIEVIYPDAIVNVQHSNSNSDDIIIDGRGPVSSSEFQASLWEDIDYLDDFIENFNHKEPPTTKVVRAIAAPCENESTSAFLVVASKDFRLVFDDVDAWFVQTCAGVISQTWHKHLLKEAIVAKEKFLRGITHQLRTPIHGILGSVELLAEELKSRDHKKDDTAIIVRPAAVCADPFIYINTIKTAGQDLISIVNSMITLNQWADVATTKRDDAPHTIRELGMEFSGAITQAFSEDTDYKPSVFLNHEFPPEVDALWIDLKLLKHSLIPIFVNAIQNTAEGVVMITATLRQDCKELVIDVEDTGCGIRADDQRRIFDAYEKVDIHSMGAGLGLTLSAKFATLLGGSVELVSSTDRGSHFRATFGKVQCQLSSTPRPHLKTKLNALPRSYYTLASNPNCVSLCKYLSRFLNGHGFTASDSIADSFIILDYEPDLERRQQRFSEIPPDQVAVCLIPASEFAAECLEAPTNIVFVKPPFLSSTLGAALEQADAFLREMQASKAPVPASEELKVTLPEPTKEVEAKGEVPQPTGLGISGPPTETETEVRVDPEPPVSIQPVLSSPAKTPTSMVKIITPIVVPIFPNTPKSPKPAALLVDDNAINLRIMQMYCNKRNLPYHSATDGRQAIEIYAQHQGQGQPGIELVLMDLQMPVCDGIEATREIRRLEAQNDWPRSALFIVTGQDSAVDRMSAEVAGADEYFVKPMGIKLLDRAVGQYFPEFQDSL